MKLFEFLKENLAWNFDKNTFDGLCLQPTSESDLFVMLDRLSNKYFPQRDTIKTARTEFCLNEIALQQSKTEEMKCVKQHFNEFWQTFLRVKTVFERGYTFPSDGKLTRLEHIAQLVARCTQFAANKQTMEHICEKVRNTFDLEERESRNLENILALYRVNFFCAAAKDVAESEKNQSRLAKMLNSNPLKTDFVQNNHLSHTLFSCNNLVANVDCLANSATKFHSPTAVDLKQYFYVNGKNMFDTFCFSKFGKKTAQFRSKNNSLCVDMQYFLQNDCEIRRYNVKNLGKTTKKLTTDFLLRHLNAGDKTTFFAADGALCLAVEGSAEFYCALALVQNNKIVPCPFEEGRVSAQMRLPVNGEVSFDAVTLFSSSMPDLANKLQLLNCYGATVCPYLNDTPSDSVVAFPTPLFLSSHGHTKRSLPQKEATTLNFTYQLGNENVASFLDNDGNITTLLNGFVFGVQGEKVYSVKNGVMTAVNCGKFAIEHDGVTFSQKNANCSVVHGNSKTYNVSYTSPQKTLFYFPLEEKCTVSFADNVFTLQGPLRKFSVACKGKVESFTTNALECNSERLRYKLSNNLTCGSCLAICFATATTIQLEISSQKQLPKACPLVRESLVSTYMNYLNDKNVFCLNNHLKRADSLTLAAITFTNPQFVKQFVGRICKENSFYYDVSGRRKQFYDRLAISLAVVYYAGLTEDENFPTAEMRDYVNGVMFNETFHGRDICVKALLVKKASRLKGFDKVRCLIEYNNLKKIFCKDASLYGYAQAIGALPLVHPSKERLKDLCNKYDIPKCWYYVSQLENLYGMTLVEGALNFSPKVSQENVLEQLALNVCGKRIDTTFTKSTVQSMTLNGTKCFSAFKAQSLKNTNNTLEVRY